MGTASRQQGASGSSPASPNCVCASGVSCAPVTTGWHPGSMSRGHLFGFGKTGRLAARSVLGSPGPGSESALGRLEIGGSLCLLLTPLH